MAARRKLPWRGALATIVGAAMLTTVVRSVTARQPGRRCGQLSIARLRTYSAGPQAGRRGALCS